MKCNEKLFWSKVKKTKKCWIWTGKSFWGGYGQFLTGSRADNSRRCLAVHRLAYILSFGPIKNGLFCCHKCNKKECVNPKHLYLATNRQNMLDASKDGLLKRTQEFKKNRTGSKNPATNLHEKDVKTIRKLYKSGKYDQYQLADKFKVGQSTISRIVRREKWTHI